MDARRVRRDRRRRGGGVRPPRLDRLEGARPGARNSLRAMERTWRKATIAVTVFAALELVAVAGLGMALLGNPLAKRLKAEAAAAAAPRVRTSPRTLPTKTTLARNQTSVIVLNANGRARAASSAAAR